MWCLHCNRAFWWESAEPIAVTPARKITRAQKAKDANPPPPYYMRAECELDRIARVAREQAATAAEAEAAAAEGTGQITVAAA
jgi:hypothetical protein